MPASEQLVLASNERQVGQYPDIYWSDEQIGGNLNKGTLYVTNQRVILSKTINRILRKNKTLYYAYPLSDVRQIRILHVPIAAFWGIANSDNCKAELVTSNAMLSLSMKDYETFSQAMNDIHRRVTGKEEDIVGPQKTILGNVADSLGNAAKEFVGSLGIVPALDDISPKLRETRRKLEKLQSKIDDKDAPGTAPSVPKNPIDKGSLDGRSMSRTDTQEKSVPRKPPLSGERQTRKKQTPRRVVRQCPTCGARLTGIEGRTVICEYCDNPLQM